MLNRIASWLRRVWREATRPEEEVWTVVSAGTAGVEEPFPEQEPPAVEPVMAVVGCRVHGFETYGFRIEAGKPVEFQVGYDDWQTVDELQSRRRALLDAYQPKPVRGPDDAAPE